MLPWLLESFFQARCCRLHFKCRCMKCDHSYSALSSVLDHHLIISPMQPINTRPLRCSKCSGFHFIYTYSTPWIHNCLWLVLPVKVNEIIINITIRRTNDGTISICYKLSLNIHHVFIMRCHCEKYVAWCIQMAGKQLMPKMVVKHPCSLFSPFKIATCRLKWQLSA